MGPGSAAQYFVLHTRPRCHLGQMAEDLAKPVLLAKIGRPHGVKGAVRVKTFTDDPMAIGRYGPLAGNDGRSFSIAEIRPDKTGVIARFKGVADRNAAEALNGVDLYVDRSVLPEPEEDEFYLTDLIGLAAELPDGATLGTVSALQDFGAGDMLEITPPMGPSRLIPFTKAAVPVIDIAARRLVVDPPPEIEVHEADARPVRGKGGEDETP